MHPSKADWIQFCHIFNMKLPNLKFQSTSSETSNDFPVCVCVCVWWGGRMCGEKVDIFVKKFSSVQFSHSVVSDSLRPHGLQHARLPCPSPTPEAYSNSCPLHRCAIQPSHPLSSPSPPAFNLSQHQGLFQ